MEDMPREPYMSYVRELGAASGAPVVVVDTSCALPMKSVGKAYLAAGAVCVCVCVCLCVCFPRASYPLPPPRLLPIPPLASFPLPPWVSSSSSTYLHPSSLPLRHACLQYTSRTHTRTHTHTHTHTTHVTVTSRSQHVHPQAPAFDIYYISSINHLALFPPVRVSV